jgi:hypothetical protein
MTRAAFLATCVLVSLWGGCGSSDEDAGPVAPEEVRPEDLLITVSGQVELFPEASQYLASQSEPLPALEGLAVRIEEPLRVAVNDPDAPLATGSVGSAGTYRVSDVPVRNIALSLSAGVGEASGSGGLMRSSTVLFDTALTQTRPRRDLVETHAYALPLRYVDALTQAVGPGEVLALSGGTLSNLRETGFVLGRVVDAEGKPVSGARIVLDRPELAGQIFYPSADTTTPVGTFATRSSGLFLFAHTGGDVETFRIGVEGAPGTYVPRNAGGARGLAVVLTLTPGTQP